MTIAQNVKSLREEFDLTQQELADKIGVAKMQISSYERGIKVPGVDTLTKLADTFDVSMDFLVGRTVKR